MVDFNTLSVLDVDSMPSDMVGDIINLAKDRLNAGATVNSVVQEAEEYQTSNLPLIADYTLIVASAMKLILSSTPEDS